MNGTRVTSDDTSRVSLTIGVIVAIVAIAGVIFLIFTASAAKRKIAGFDPNRPVPTDAELRARLNEDQYRVTRQNGGETPFRNEFWNNERTGIYVDVATGEPLFTSLDKFDGGTGRPCFTKPISKDLLVEKKDFSQEMERTAVAARRSNSHLGHVFDDPTSPTKQRYVVKSAAFRFIPVERMKKEDYEQYLSLFDQKK